MKNKLFGHALSWRYAGTSVFFSGVSKLTRVQRIVINAISISGSLSAGVTTGPVTPVIQVLKSILHL